MKGNHISRELLIQEMWHPQRINYGLGWFLLIPDKDPYKGHVIGAFHYADTREGYECMIHVTKGPELDVSTAVVMGRRKQRTEQWWGPHLQLVIDLAAFLP